MPSIEKEIVSWFSARPVWLQRVMVCVARNGGVSDDFLEETATGLISGRLVLTDPPLSVDDLSSGTSSGQQVWLSSIGDLRNVNALLEGQTLTFGGTGITVVYGDNSSGKSGYARLIKEIAGARHRERILPDAFDPSAGVRQQSATIEYSVDSSMHELSWPESSDANTKAIHFHDEACGDDYLASDTEFSYRPSVLRLFDDTITATDALRQVMDGRLQAHATPVALPRVEEGTAAAAFIRGLTATTTAEQIEEASHVDEGADEALADLIQEEARLQATNPAKERTRLEKVSAAITALASHLGAYS